MSSRSSGLVRLLVLLMVSTLFAVAPLPAVAAVQITFLSKEFGGGVPHAYVILEGSLDQSGERISANYGFSATRVSPAALLGPVQGEVGAATADYVRRSERHFTALLSDADYDRVMATVERWRALKQPSYNLNRRNCVHFVAEVAAAIGMKADLPAGLVKKPRAFVEMLSRKNRPWLAAREARAPQSRSAVAGRDQMR